MSRGKDAYSVEISLSVDMTGVSMDRDAPKEWVDAEAICTERDHPLRARGFDENTGYAWEGCECGAMTFYEVIPRPTPRPAVPPCPYPCVWFPLAPHQTLQAVDSGPALRPIVAAS
jgi:hypothetical protein